jgi:hypothetical protein
VQNHPFSPVEEGEPRRTGESGQTLVEFALAVPIVFFSLMALIELALGYNAFVGVNRASQQAAHMASIAGNQSGADCLILRGIEESVSSPNRDSSIIDVRIQRTSLAGNWAYQQQLYTRDGTMTCELPNGDEITLPYQQLEDGYPETQRCTALKGCPEMGDRSTVDNIAVGIKYRHDWITPMASVITSLPGGTAGWTFTQRNIFRMEPTL